MVRYFRDEEFGDIKVEFRKGMRSIAVAIKSGKICMRAPEGLPIEFLVTSLNKAREKLRNNIAKSLEKSEALFTNDMQIKCCGFTITITTDVSKNGTVKMPDTMIVVPKHIDFSDSKVISNFSKTVRHLLKNRFYILQEMAMAVAKELGVTGVKGIVMGRGTRKLGSCSTKGEIRLSYMLLLLPEHLVRYVICHELAHLKHFDHSPAFHALCNTYVGGHEQEYQSELKQFRWPVE